MSFLLPTYLLHAEEPPAVLVAGGTVEQRIAPGETHTYLAPLATDAFLRLVVEQRGCDVVLTRFTPGGSQVEHVDSPEDAWGPELLVMQAEREGSHRIEVRAKTGGSYRLHTSNPEPSDARDRRRLAAERFATAGAALQLKGSTAGRQGAVQQYLKALDLWRLEGAQLEQARTLHALGAVYDQLGESEQATQHLQEALLLWQATSEPHGEANSLNQLGSVALARGERQQAERFYLQALALRRSLGERCGQAQTLNNLGTLHVVLGKAENALENYRPALELCGEEEDPALHAALLAGLGGAHRRLGNLLEALETTARTLPIFRALGNHQVEALMLQNMAVYHRELGASQPAFEYFQQALTIFRRLEDRNAEARVLNGLGQVYLQLGEPGQALVVLEQALVLRRAVGDRRGEAVTLHSLAWAHSKSDAPGRAAEICHQALKLRRELDDRTGEATSLGLLGILYHQLGRLEPARKMLQEALERQAALGNPHRQAALLRHLGETYFVAGDFEAAREALQESLGLERQVRNRVGEIETLGALARTEIRLDQGARGEELLGIARKLLESLRIEILDPDLRASFLATQGRIFETSIGLAMERHRRQRDEDHHLTALALSEQARARSFLEVLSEVDAGLEGGTEPALLARRHALQQRLNAAAARERRALATIPTPEVAQELAEELQSLLIALQEVEGEIRRQNPAYGELTRPRLLDAAEMQGLLDGETLMLLYALGEDISFLWVVSKEQVHSFELPPRQVIEDAARHLHRLWSTLDPTRQQEDRAAAEELRQLVLEPAAGLVAQARRLVIVADGALHYLPFGALPAFSREAAEREVPLLSSHEMVYLPSASVLAQLRGRDRGTAKLAATSAAVAVVADPIFALDDPRLAAKLATSQPLPSAGGDVLRAAPLESGFERLPASRLEAQAIASLAPNDSTLLLLDGAARREAVMGHHLSGYKILHFATHGVIDTERPRLSGLALSHFDPEGRPVDGFLALHEIYNLHLDAELVVLSGCRTALGKEIRGEGLVGLSRAFMYAGAARVVASLWRVQDRATSELMQRFYHAVLIKGERPAQALRSARRSLAAEPRFQDPYFWSAFVHVGDWR